MVTVEIQIAAPVQHVFALMSDFAHAPDNIRDITRIEMITPGPVGVGTKFKESRVMFGKEATETMEVTAFDPPRSYTLGTVSCGVAYESTFRFEPEGEGTKLTLSFEIKPRSFLGKLLSPLLKGLMAGMMKKCIKKDMEDVKRVAEALPSI